MNLTARVTRIEQVHLPTARIKCLWSEDEADADRRQAEMSARCEIGPLDTVVRVFLSTSEAGFKEMIASDEACHG
jgi:hypothetical protein